MTDLLQRLVALTAKDESGLPTCAFTGKRLHVSTSGGKWSAHCTTINCPCKQISFFTKKNLTSWLTRCPREAALIALVQEWAGEIERLRVALKYYASEDNYNDDCAPILPVFVEGVDCEAFDVGRTARRALNQQEDVPLFPHPANSPPRFAISAGAAALLTGTQSSTATQSASSRSTDPPAHAVPRSHRKPNSPGESTVNLIELSRALHQLRLGGMAAVLETRLRQAQAEAMAPIDLISCLVSDELTRRTDRLLERRRKQARFRDPDRTLDNFDFTFNPKMNRRLVFDLATGAFINKREDALFLGPGGTGKSHLAQAIGQAALQQGCKVFYRESHILLDELAEAVADGTRKEYMESVATVPLLIIDDFGMRKLPHTAAEDLLEIVMRRYERFSTLLTSNRPVEDWGKLLGDVAAVSAMLDRLLHHGHVLKCGPRSWRTKTASAS